MFEERSVRLYLIARQITSRRGVGWLHRPKRLGLGHPEVNLLPPRPATRFMVGEETLPQHVQATLPRLEVGAEGGTAAVFRRLRTRALGPSALRRDRRQTGEAFRAVRPDGSLKPHAEMIEEFAATHPRRSPPTRTVTLDVTPDECYLDPEGHARRSYESF